MPRNTSFSLFVFLISAFSIAQADVAALGRLEPNQGVRRVSAPVILESGNGILLNSLDVKVGDKVAAGQVVAVTESAELLRAIRDQAKSMHQLAIEEADAAEAVANADCVRAAVSQREADRRKSLLEQDLSSLEESERASADAEFQQAGCDASTKTAQASHAAIDVAAKQVAVRETLLTRAYIKAPFDGTVLQIFTWPGEAIGAQGILALAKTDQMYAIAEIYETDITKVATGQQAKITSNAFSDTLTGVVEFIRPVVRKQDVMGTDPAASKDARVIEVEIRLVDPSMVENLTNLQVEILIES